jgi:hypothetical protein
MNTKSDGVRTKIAEKNMMTDKRSYSLNCVKIPFSPELSIDSVISRTVDLAGMENVVTKM